jgi:hypothetical protein
MSEVNELAVAAGGADARTGLRAALALRRLAERLEALQVSNARRQGWSWQEIADALEVSKQAVHQKHAARAAAPETPARPRPTQEG